MKLEALSQPINGIKLTVRTTSKHYKQLLLPKDNIHFWYPFNINFTYRYTEAKNYLYLIKEKGYTGTNLYNANILKRTKPLEYKDGIMFHPHIFKRNMYIIHKANSLGISTICEDYTLQDVEKGFDLLGSLIQAVRNKVEDRFIWENEEAPYVLDSASEEWDEQMYNQATEKELTALEEFGEMYTMLTIMRKLAEVE